MSLQVFFHEIEKGLSLPVYLLYASDLFFHREAIEAIKRLVPEVEREFNLHIFDLSSSGEEDLSFAQIVDVANTIPFFGKRRFVVLVVNLQKLSKGDNKRLDDYISNPAPSTVYLILHEGTLKKELRERFRMVKTISLDIREPEIPDWIKQRAKIKGLEISDRVADYMLGIIGTDFGLLSAEIEKISLLGKQKIDVDDISHIIAGEGSYSIFDLVDALIDKDSERVFRIYKTLRETTDDYSLIGALNWQFGRSLSSGSKPKEDDYFLRIFELLHKADRDIKSSGRTFPMEYLLVKLLRL
ncbi:MAG: DNA polymerase III subunit delta [Nitrospira sp.]|nr:DNA polymerase III subunit delta [Nitrospira sp.]